jgi:DNA-binding PadR family transcriptional regulator
MARDAVPELTRLEHILLSALGSQERYGLEILDKIKTATGDRVSISLGGLYTTLHRMEKRGLVKGHWGDTAEGRQGARRRYYKATGLGLRALTQDREIYRRAWRLAPFGARLVLEG